MHPCRTNILVMFNLFSLLLFSSFSTQGSATCINVEKSFSYDIVKPEITSITDRFEGYNLYVVERTDSVDWNSNNRTIVISDLNNNIYFTKEIYHEAALADYAAEFINSTTILYGDLEGAFLWNLETNVTEYLNFCGHHDYEKNYANDTYFALNGDWFSIDDIVYGFDKIMEFNSDGELIWQVNTTDFVLPSQWCPYEDGSESSRDITHSNTVFYDEEEDVVYLNCRNLNTFYKIDHKTGEVIWALGEYGNFTLFDIYGNEKYALFYHAHALEMVDKNKFIIFDNDEHNQTDATNHRSRLLEITIDEDKMYANASWEWISPPEYFRGWWGDNDRLPNNNHLGVFKSACLVEVNEAGEIIWEQEYSNTGSMWFGIYKAERIRFAPTVSEPRFIALGENDSFLEWDIWYNYRSKTEFVGEYFLMVDDVQVATGPVVYPRFWDPTQITYNISLEELDDHEIELIVSDEAGHLSNETDRFNPIGVISPVPSIRFKVILGLSIGLGVPTLASILFAIWWRLIKKKPLKFKKINRLNPA